MPTKHRFDAALMQPPTWSAGSDERLLAAVGSWCAAEALPVLTAPLRAASIAPGGDLNAVACVLDGSDVLRRLGRWRGLAFRLWVVVRERLPGCSARASDPWDCGWWRPGPLAIAAAFRPRRPTLLLVRAADVPAAAELLSTLQAASAAYRRPLRVLFESIESLADLPRLAS
jgi:hypothetical protein